MKPKKIQKFGKTQKIKKKSEKKIKIKKNKKTRKKPKKRLNFWKMFKNQKIGKMSKKNLKKSIFFFFSLIFFCQKAGWLENLMVL